MTTFNFTIRYHDGNDDSGDGNNKKKRMKINRQIKMTCDSNLSIPLENIKERRKKDLVHHCVIQVNI